MSNLDDIRTVIALLDDEVDVHGFVKIAAEHHVIDSIVGTDDELDGIALLAVACRRFANSQSMWKFIQRAVDEAEECAEAAFTVAEAISYTLPLSSSIKFNIVRLTYYCANNMLFNRFEGYSNLWISCIRTLVKIEQFDQALLFMEELGKILNDEPGGEIERSYVLNNEQFLRTLDKATGNKVLGRAARSIMQKFSN